MLDTVPVEEAVPNLTSVKQTQVESATMYLEDKMAGTSNNKKTAYVKYYKRLCCKVAKICCTKMWILIKTVYKRVYKEKIHGSSPNDNLSKLI